ncbi:caspase, EACC1-associated type [Nostoc sp. FACHB-280]|uniref:caspase family protein n=1 Tax=Nostoc sp. FACHB-280 TaxID=2692839 RepID=UPI00168AD580|nr:caspase family protein [Nostoc sp. FACHB-280]MBD2498391.1 caspase family protein [Nostoc sp. FACHB-280]
MEKFALLIGISEYEPCLAPIPTAIKDADALREVLTHPEMGGFPEENVTMLHNPSRLDMEIAIYKLFSECKKDDLVLFFFSGHGITDEVGRLYLSTRETRKAENGKLITPTSVAASFIHEQMSNSRSKRQVVILDSCFSAAFAKGMSAKDDLKVDIQAQLGGKGRAVLTSSSPTQYSIFEDNEELSIYTRYLVEGIRTGAADEDDDGYISIAELHEYARKKVTGTTPQMTPQIFYIAEEGDWIQIATTLSKASRLKFQRAEALKKEFNNWLDLVFKYEAEKKADSLPDSLANSLADGLIENIFTPCLKRWRERNVGYFTILDLENKVITESSQWFDNDAARSLMEKAVNDWIIKILTVLKPNISNIAYKYSLDVREFEGLIFGASDEVKLKERICDLSKSPTFRVLSEELLSGIRLAISILSGSLGLFVILALLLLVVALTTPSRIALLFGSVLASILSIKISDLFSKLPDILTKDLPLLRKTDLPVWMRKKISDKDIADQLASTKRELKYQIQNALKQNPILVSQIIEEAIPEIKRSFAKNLEQDLKSNITQ